MTSHDSDIAKLAQAGFFLQRGVYSAEECAEIIRALQQALSGSTSPVVQKRGEVIYGARDLLRVFPDACRLWQRAPLLTILRTVLDDCSDNFGLVRGLFFDKPDGAGWSLPWHRDLTIAVQDNRLPSSHFQRPTNKAGVPHVEAPRELLERMLTLRIHLDDVTAANGPLRVAPGSQRNDEDEACADTDEAAAEMIYAAAGDVLAMRPRLMHSSAGVKEGPGAKPRHRRIIHLEFAADEHLPDGFAWRDFVRAGTGLPG